LKVGFLISYVAPLVFVLAITLIKEGVDDIKRYKRDKEINEKVYLRMKAGGGEE
jgi:phospholipid-translocating ATPase